MAGFYFHTNHLTELNVQDDEGLEFASVHVTTYRISIVNEHFSSSEDHKAADPVTAWQMAIRGAIDIARDQVSHGVP